MAGRNQIRLNEYSSERHDGTNDSSVRKKQTSKNEMNIGGATGYYRNYDVYSDRESVLRLNPVNYTNQVKSMRKGEGSKETSDIMKALDAPTCSLIANIDKIQSPPVSTFIETAAHIIGPTPNS